MARLVQGALHGWLCSPDQAMAASHIAEDLKCPPSQQGQVANYAKELFAQMYDPTKPDVKLPHDGYLSCGSCRVRICRDDTPRSSATNRRS
jgi:hypothetical protein